MDDEVFPSYVYDAAEVGDVATLVQLLECHPEWVDWHSPSGLTPLHSAGTLEAVKLLVARGAHINSEDSTGRTPLYKTAESGDSLDIAKFFLQNGADPNISDNRGSTPLHAAVQGGHLEIVKVLLMHGARVECWDSRGRTPLMRAARKMSNDSVALATALMEHGAKLDLNSAVLLGNVEFVRERVLRDRADIYNAFFPSDLLADAVRIQSVELVSLLLACGLGVNRVGTSSCTALCIACETNAPSEIVKLLLDHGADIAARRYSDNDDSFETPVVIAKRMSNTELVSLLST